MVADLSEAGHAIDLASVRAIAGSGSIGRVHVARALVAAGSVPTVDAAFRMLIGRDAPFYRRKRTLDAAQAIAAIHGAGGVAVFAHPGVTGEGALPALLAAGLDGIEAFHAEHSADDKRRFAEMAADLGLIVTGGSDFHADDVPCASIGGGGCPESALEALWARAARYRR
jgi:predicted metal-dependent phosphoesterase TrpH